ncbi:MAG: tail fiber domain-containing protein [Acidobacteriota bacterium]
MKLHKTVASAALSALLIGSAGSAFGAPQLADVQVGGAGVAFTLQGAGTGSYTVVLGGPDGFRAEQDFKGQAPFFSLTDKQGNALPAGLYTWTLTENRVADSERDASTTFQARTQSGSFTILDNGSLASPDLVEGGFNKAVTVTQDQIIQGSQCVGLDCTSSESFGFDTLRLKENNLRIHFDDTSGSASFPSNDWRITINDSSNGGAEFFAVDDATGGKTPFKIEAGSPNNSLYVASEGRIGVRNNNPVVDVHVTQGNSPTLRLDQDGSSGFTPQTWDLSGNEANFFIRDVTNGSKLPFRIKPGAPDDTLYLDANGEVGIGTDNPDGLLHVKAASGSGGNVRISGDNVGFVFEDDTSSIQHFINADRYRIRALDSTGSEAAAGISVSATSGVVGVNCNDGVAPSAASTANFVVGDGDGCDGVYTAITAGSQPVISSSRSLKENLSPVASSDILEKIAAIDVYTYDFIEGPQDRLGLMAEDFHQIFGRGSEKMIPTQDVQMAMWLAIQELTGQITELKAELAAANK